MTMKITLDNPEEAITFEELYRIYMAMRQKSHDKIPSYYDGYCIGYNAGYDAGVKAERDNRNNIVDSMGNHSP